MSAGVRPITGDSRQQPKYLLSHYKQCSCASMVVGKYRRGFDQSQETAANNQLFAFTIGCLRFTKFCWVGKHANIIMKPTNTPTQGQPNNPRTMAFGPHFPAANNFSWVGIDFI